MHIMVTDDWGEGDSNTELAPDVLIMDIITRAIENWYMPTVPDPRYTVVLLLAAVDLDLIELLKRTI